MRTIINKRVFLIFAIFAILNFTGCDIIDDNPYIIKHSIDPPEDPDDTEKSVLVIKFTGHQCPNCPAGTEILNSLERIHGKKITTLAVHSGGFARTLPQSDFTYDFRTEFGNKLDSKIKPNGYPKALVGSFDPAKQAERGEWENLFNEEIEIKTSISISIENKISDSNLLSKVTVNNTDDLTVLNNLSVVAVITEDSIVKPQKRGSSTILDYVHNHVLRVGLSSDIYGDPVLFDKNNKFTINYEKNMSTEWKTNKLKVVAYIIDNETLKIIQTRYSSVE